MFQSGKIIIKRLENVLLYGSEYWIIFSQMQTWSNRCGFNNCWEHHRDRRNEKVLENRKYKEIVANNQKELKIYKERRLGKSNTHRDPECKRSRGKQ